MGKDRLQIEVLTLIQNITENRLRHARGPVHYIESITFKENPEKMFDKNENCKDIQFYYGKNSES